MKDLEEKISQTTIKTIEELSDNLLINLENKDKININTKLDDLEIFEDSLNLVVFFSSLETNLSKELKRSVIIKIEDMDLEIKVIQIKDLVKYLNKIIG